MQRRRLIEYGSVALGLTLATAFVTWPHAAVFTHSVVSSIDPLFSMWRLAWFAHAVANQLPLVDANTFHPESATLLLSDATFLQGALAAPAIWAGVGLPVLYNTFMLIGLVSSGLALYHVARVFDVAAGPAFVGATIFTLAPYRIEHIMHLELQWVAPGILALAALHRVLVAPTWRSAAALGLLTATQFLACVYYAVFLLPLLGILAGTALLWAVMIGTDVVPNWKRTVAYGIAAGVLAGAIALPVAALYVRQGSEVGPRTREELISYSATLSNYLSAPQENVVYGFTAESLGAGERRLFPGAVAVGAALAGLFSRRRTLKVGAFLVMAAAVILSLGVNSWPYRFLYSLWSVLHGLRAPARYSIYALGGLALLAALGLEWALARWRLSARGRQLALALVLLAVCVEYRSPQTMVTRVDMKPPVYEFLRRAPDGVVLELPFSPPLSGAPDPLGRVDYDSDYIYWSTTHWHKIINGYSGYYPPSYDRTRRVMESFPDDASMAYLAERGVRYVLLHASYMKPPETARIIESLTEFPHVLPLGTYRDWIGATHVFEITTPTASVP